MSYAEAGVDIAAGDRAVELIGDVVLRTRRPGVVGGFGGFASLFELDLNRWPRPLLASSTDGVGTKIAVARAMGIHDTVGIDLVAMLVDDLVCCGAEPLFLQDYIAVGRVVPERIHALVTGIAAGCKLAGCALVGGETAEHADLMGAEDYDLSGTAVGVVDTSSRLGAERVRAGDVLVAMGSSGLHSNGYVLARRVLLRDAGLDLQAEPAGLGRSLGAELLEPCRIYAKDCLALAALPTIRVFAHITGGGLAANLARVLPTGTEAVLDRATWSPQPIFGLIGELGGVAPAGLERTFNMGVGMVAVVGAQDADRALRLLADRGVPAWVAGIVGVAKGPAPTGTARLVNDYGTG